MDTRNYMPYVFTTDKSSFFFMTCVKKIIKHNFLPSSDQKLIEMYSNSIEHCIKIMNMIGSHPEKGYTMSQIVLFVYSMSLGFFIVLLSILMVVEHHQGDIPRAFSTCFLYLHVSISPLDLRHFKI